MAGYHLNRKAEEDLLDIWRYIAENNPANATKLIRTFHQHFVLLASRHISVFSVPGCTKSSSYKPMKTQ